MTRQKQNFKRECFFKRGKASLKNERLAQEQVYPPYIPGEGEGCIVNTIVHVQAVSVRYVLVTGASMSVVGYEVIGESDCTATTAKGANGLRLVKYNCLYK